MAAALVPLSLQTIFDANGRVALGASLYFYDAGTTTPKTVYQAADLASPFASPVTVNAAGRVPPVYVGEGLYKVRIIARGGVLIDEIDGIQGVPPKDTGGGGGGDFTSTVLPVGYLSAAYASSPVAGWVRANGRTIGDAGSGASERANIDCHDLYVHLWNLDSSLEVPGGRGTDAESDWLARKRITLPDLRGRVPAGRDGMGNVVASRITSGQITDPDTVGSAGGTQTVQLSATQMPRHTHGASTGASSDHEHTGTTSNDGGHFHRYPYATYAPDGGAATGQGPVRASLQTQEDTTQPAGAHSHTLTIQRAGSHVHAVTVQETGGSEAHQNLQPTILVTWFISLGVA